MVNRIGPLTLIAALLAGCSEREAPYRWAFAQNMDNSILPNESCRESLAESLYDSQNAAKTVREATTNVFVFNGSIETYKIYGFRSQQECETALTNLVFRQNAQRQD